MLFASVPVADLQIATKWYGYLFGRAPDVLPNSNEVMWRVAGNGWLYVITDPERAGGTVVTISVTDLDQFIAALGDRGINAGPIEAVGNAGRKANVVDADGNVISWIQVAASNYQMLWTGSSTRQQRPRSFAPLAPSFLAVCRR